ncbi:MAG: NACHT domain-containing protein [Planctomycetia bacterium]|nr:NACHT domain-containing protein [Planctomycetia bacterium]
MNSGIENIILGVIANGLTAIIAHLGHKGRKFLFGEKIGQKNTDFLSLLKNAADEVAEKIEWNGPSRLEEVCLFLTSPEVEAVVRQIYSVKHSEGRHQRSFEQIKKEFLTSFSLYVGIDENKLVNSASLLFDALIEGCEHAFNMAIDDGILSAHEAKAAFRHQMILDELVTIQRNLDFLTCQQKQSIQQILEFEKQYRNQVAARHGYITPPHFDTARKLPIDTLYVSPNFVTTPKEKGEEAQLLNTLEFLFVIYRAVLLGNPGGGKSTFASKLCNDLVTQYSARLFAGRLVTPILVVLRDYGAEKKTHNYSILKFIEIIANSKYQVQPPAGAFEYMLLNSRAVVIFDGLDELLDTSYRREISSDIESFCTRYPSVPVLVTSREVGYEQAPLDEKKFENFRLSPFDENQVKEYVTKWFAADTDLTSDQQKQKAEAFLVESRIVSDLRSNPLMLALMCNLYRGENYIPGNRPDVYEKCAVMLFERWDKTRGIHVTLPIEAHISPAMKYLAHWIYSDEKLQGGATEENLVAKATEYLCPRRFEDRDEAEKAAHEFIEFCRGRAWVFTDTGTTKEGERLYQFTHRTFLEYFTAAHLVRTHPIPNKLGEILLPKIEKREWDVVAQLAFQLQNKNVEGAGDELLATLIDQARKAKNGKVWNLLSFVSRCLEFMVPSPKVTRNITTTIIEHCPSWGLKQINKEEFSPRSYRRRLYSEPAEIFYALLNAATENRAPIADSLEKRLVELINSANEPEALLFLEIGLNLGTLCHWAAERSPQQEKLEFWTNAQDRIYDACLLRIETLCPKYFRLCLEAFRLGKVSIGNLIKWYSFEGLFRHCGFSLFPNMLFAAPAELILHSVFRASYLPKVEKRLWNYIIPLKEVSHILLSYPPPWIKEKHFLFPPLYIKNQFSSEKVEEPSDLDNDTLFGIFALFAAMLEAGQRKDLLQIIKTSPIEDIKMGKISLFDRMRWIFVSRFEQVETTKVQAEMDMCGFLPDQQAFAWRWIRREINLVQQPERKKKKIREDIENKNETDEQ